MTGNVQTLIGVSLLLLLMIEVARRRLKISVHILRRIVHLVAGVINIAASVLATQQEIVFVNLAFAGLLLVGRKKKLFSTIQISSRNSYGDIFFPLGIAIAASVFLPDNLLAFQFGVAIMGFSDAIAGFVGEGWGKHRIKLINTFKTVEGSMVFFLISLLITIMLFPQYGLAILIIPLLLTMVEMGLAHGLDNLVLPFVAGLLIMLF